MVLDDLNHGVE
jgi:hypothetical protein